MNHLESLKLSAAFNLPGSLPLLKEPKIRLENWSIKTLSNNTQQFIGKKEGRELAHARVSSPIVEFDPETKCGKTRSGRVYELVGPEGPTPAVESFWVDYKKVYNLTEVLPNN